VVVSNNYGMETSSVATLTVYVPVSMMTQPVSRIVPYGATVTFNVVADGWPAPSYQWLLNGTNISGATMNRLTITHVRTNNLGNYTVRADNGYSWAVGGPATLSMSPSITIPFAGVVVNWGKSAELSVGAVGSGALSYQWYKDGEAVDGATNATYSIPTLQLTDAGLYSVVVSSEFGSVTNTPAQLVVNAADISLELYAGITIAGVPGYTYAIQYSMDLTDTNSWMDATNVVLQAPVELWVDTSADVRTNWPRYYRVKAVP